MRTFIAIDLPKELKEKIFTYARRLAGGINIKLVEKENLHLTLLFLGEMAEEEKERVMRVLRSASCRIGELGGEFMAGRVTLYQSQLGAKGPKYTKLGEFEVK